MTKHTPGPWTPEFGEAYRVRAQQDGGQVAVLTHLKGQFGMSGRRDGDEVTANARLIAAAPDLLEALKHAENALADYVPTIEKTGAALNYGHHVIKMAKAAIAKAEESKHD